MREVAITEALCIKIPGAISGTSPSAKAPGTISSTTVSFPHAVVPEIVPGALVDGFVPEIALGILMQNVSLMATSRTVG